jgi:hypothetical protein
MSEIWKTVICNDNYAVSNMGNVMRIVGGKGSRKDKLLSCRAGKIGYPVTLLTKNGVQTQHYVHRLVAEAFFGTTVGMDVNHKNGVKTDNRIENLEWCTRKYNIQHAFSVLNKQVKIKASELADVFSYSAQGVKGKDIAVFFGVTPQAICKILKGHRRSLV